MFAFEQCKQMEKRVETLALIPTYIACLWANVSNEDTPLYASAAAEKKILAPEAIRFRILSYLIRSSFSFRFIHALFGPILFFSSFPIHLAREWGFVLTLFFALLKKKKCLIWSFSILSGN